MLDYENSLNPYPERKNTIAKWKNNSQIDIKESKELLKKAEEIRMLKISSEDCIHVACSINASCDYFISTNNVLIKKLKNYKLIKSVNPFDFILKEGNSND